MDGPIASLLQNHRVTEQSTEKVTLLQSRCI